MIHEVSVFRHSGERFALLRPILEGLSLALRLQLQPWGVRQSAPPMLNKEFWREW
jgi:hypothetical protein